MYSVIFDNNIFAKEKIDRLEKKILSLQSESPIRILGSILLVEELVPLITNDINKFNGQVPFLVEKV